MCPRSETPIAPRTPKPRSVKFSPLRAVRPVPSWPTQRRSDVSTPPWRMKSSTSRPTSLSTSAVTTAVRRPKQRRSPRATLYSPPPSQTWNERAFRIRPSPGSNRSITSPSATRSNRHSLWWPERERHERHRAAIATASAVSRSIASKSPRRDQSGGDHPAATDRRHARHGKVGRQVGRGRPRRSARTGRRETGRRAPSRPGSHRAPRPGRASDSGEPVLERGDHLGRRRDAGHHRHAELARSGAPPAR